MEAKGITAEEADAIRNLESSNMLSDAETLIRTTPDQINGQADDGTSLLHIACGKGLTSLFVILFCCCCLLFCCDGMYCLFPHSVGYLAVVLVLLERRANPNIHDKEGWTPLHVAAYWDKTLMFEPLMTFGADLDLVNQDNETPLDVTENAETREKLEGKAHHKPNKHAGSQ